MRRHVLGGCGWYRWWWQSECMVVGVGGEWWVHRWWVWWVWWMRLVGGNTRLRDREGGRAGRGTHHHESGWVASTYTASRLSAPPQLTRAGFRKYRLLVYPKPWYPSSRPLRYTVLVVWMASKSIHMEAVRAASGNTMCLRYLSRCHVGGGGREGGGLNIARGRMVGVEGEGDVVWVGVGVEIGGIGVKGGRVQ